MVKPKVTKLDPKGFRRNLDFGGPSPKAPNKPTRPRYNKTSTKETLNTVKSSNGTKSAKRSRRIVESDLPSSESTASDVSAIFVDNFSPPLVPNQTPEPPPSPTSSSTSASHPGNQLVTVTAEVHASQKGSKTLRRGSKLPTSLGPPVDLIDANEITEIAETSEEPAVIKSKTHPIQTQPNIAVSEAAQNASLPPPPR
jgi:hypothetical protein